jgi:hypothetical protein
MDYSREDVDEAYRQGYAEGLQAMYAAAHRRLVEHRNPLLAAELDRMRGELREDGAERPVRYASAYEAALQYSRTDGSISRKEPG